MTDTVEFTIEIDDVTKTNNCIARDLREFGSYMRSVLTANSVDDLRSANSALQYTYGVRVTSTRRVFRSQS